MSVSVDLDDGNLPVSGPLVSPHASTSTKSSRNSTETGESLDGTGQEQEESVPPSPPFKEKTENQKLDAMAVWSGFFKKTLRERQDQIRLVYPDVDISVLHDGGLLEPVADVMVENCIGIASLPIGVAPNFIVNQNLYVVPMCVEEPSVIAAASGVAKLISGCGGFTAVSSSNIMTAQVQLCDWKSREEMLLAIELIDKEASNLIDYGNMHCESMKKRGGGVIAVYARLVEPRRKRLLQPHGYVIVHIDVNVCEAMGANIVNTIAEGLAPHLESLTNSRIGLKILTNLCTKRITKSSFRIAVEELKWKGVEGKVVAERILEAYHFADDDEFRAATHNKGVCNGMDAVAIALGQDWRAIESAAHSYMYSKYGYYGPVTSYYLEEVVDEVGVVSQFLIGSIEMPMAVGTKGGALQTHPLYKFTHSLIGNPDAQTVGQIICSVGLAQNFAALRALAIEGIQKGHMSLHARNIAVAAGVPNALVAEVAAYMVSRNKISIDSAREYLIAHSIFQNQNSLLPASTRPLTPSTFSVEFSASCAINIAFATIGHAPVHIVIDKNRAPHPMQEQLLGVNKGFAWLSHVYQQLNRIKLSPNRLNAMTLRSTSAEEDKLKLISILLNLICNNLLCSYPAQTSTFLQVAINLHDNRLDLSQLVPVDDPILSTGFPLVLELWRVFYFSVDQWVASVNANLASAIIAQQCFIINCMISRQSVYSSVVKDDTLTTTRAIFKFMQVHSCRWQATMFLLCDCVSLSLTVLSPSRLEFIHKLGEYFEWEGTFSHDMQRARQTESPHPTYFSSTNTYYSNVYKLWLVLEDRTNSEESEQCFLKIVNDQSIERQRAILECKEDVDFFDADNFLRSAALLREEYNISPLLR